MLTLQESILTDPRIVHNPQIVGFIAGLALLVSGCAGLTGPNGLGQNVLVACKLAPEQQTAGQNRANGYFAQVASGKIARPARRYVAVQTLDPNKKQETKYAQTKALCKRKLNQRANRLVRNGSNPPNCTA
jgi:hypothetical protein